MSRGAWTAVDFGLPPQIPTMITREEVQYLYWLTREHWSGEHALIEFGPWLGGSTYCLAAGMAANPRRSPGSRLHVIDNFRWQEFMSSRASLELAPGMSFRAAFEANLSEFEPFIEVHEARLPDEPITTIEPAELGDFDADLPLFDGRTAGDQAEIVFIDGAKSWRALVHAFRELGPRWIPGTTLLVFQDYKVCGGYWVQMGVAKLLTAMPPAVELLHVLPSNSVSFRLTERFDPRCLAELPETIDAISGEEGGMLLDHSRVLLESAGDERAARLVDLSAVVFLGSKGLWDDAVGRFRAVERRWPLRESPGELDRVRSWLEANAGATVRRSSRSAARVAYERARSKAAGIRRRLAP